MYGDLGNKLVRVPLHSHAPLSRSTLTLAKGPTCQEDTESFASPAISDRTRPIGNP